MVINQTKKMKSLNTFVFPKTPSLYSTTLIRELIFMIQLMREISKFGLIWILVVSF